MDPAPDLPPSFSRGRKWSLTVNLVVILLATGAVVTMINFLAARHHSRIGFPTHGIRSLLAAPAFERLTKSGATIRTETSVSHIRFDAHRVTGVQLQSGNTLVADWYVAALPHRRLCSLLPEGTLAHYAYFEQLTRLTDSPAVTVHLWIDRALPAPRLVLLTGRTFHWLVSRARAGAEGQQLLYQTAETIDLADHDTGVVTDLGLIGKAPGEQLCSAFDPSERVLHFVRQSRHQASQARQSFIAPRFVFQLPLIAQVLNHQRCALDLTARAPDRRAAQSDGHAPTRHL